MFLVIDKNTTGEDAFDDDMIQCFKKVFINLDRE